MKVILYDGWPLLNDPTGAQALHLLTLLIAAREGTRQILALPYELQDIPPGIETAVHLTPSTPYGKLVWEQRLLPSLFKHTQAHLLFTTGSGIPIGLANRTIVSPAVSTGFPWASPEQTLKSGFWERFRSSLAAGALSQVKAILWPRDLSSAPQLGTRTQLLRINPTVHPDFMPSVRTRNNSQFSQELPDSYILVNEPITLASLDSILAVWSWAAGSIGETTPLVIPTKTALWKQASVDKADLHGKVLFIEPRSIHALADLYHGASVVLKTNEPAPWGGSLRHALAAGKPVAAAGYPWAKEIAGPAAYLAPPGDSRLLGAALLTLLVEESVSEQVSRAASNRSAGWHMDEFSENLRQLIL